MQHVIFYGGGKNPPRVSVTRTAQGEGPVREEQRQERRTPLRSHAPRS